MYSDTDAFLDSPFIALILLEHGADTTITDAGGFSALQLASRCFHMTTYRILLEAGGHTVGKLDTGLSRVEMHILEASSAKETDTKIEGKSSNNLGSLSQLKEVLARSVDCALGSASYEDDDYFFQTRSALQYTIENGDPIIAQTLIDAGVDLNNYEEKGDGPRHRLPLEMKIPKGLIRITEVLVKHIDCGKIKGATRSNSSDTDLVNYRGEWRVAIYLVTSLAK